MKQATHEEWDIVVKPKHRLWHFGFGEVWKYRDLIFLFVKRDWSAAYKQTILGPVWYLIQPVFTVIIYYFMFGKIARISTGDIPNMVYYLGGLTIWNYFVECANATSNVFVNNAHLFGKVYFPRLIVPVSATLSALLKLSIQLVLFLCFWSYYHFHESVPQLHIGLPILLLPVLVAETAILGMSFGLIVSAFTTKYRDLKNLVSYVLQFGLYSSPIIFSLDWMRDTFPLFYKISLLNPMSGIVEVFKSAFWENPNVNGYMIVYPACFTLVFFLFAVVLFNRVEKTFLDTV